MRVHALNLVAGTSACNARCPFCISKMTPKNGICLKARKINLRNLKKACTLAKMSGAATIKITGKGEPTLYPWQITEYLKAIKEFNFPLIELQTNGILLAQQWKKYLPYLNQWYNLGLNTIIISIVHYDAEKNRQLFLPHEKQYTDLPELIAQLHNLGFSIRLSCILVNGFICGKKEAGRLIRFAKNSNVEQLTLIPVTVPKETGNSPIVLWAKKHALKTAQGKEIRNYLEKQGHRLMELPHGGVIYDLNGQNICIADCLTTPKDMRIRHLIFFPDGHIRYDWQYKGAVIL
ncbi:MAG: hypothetical protein KJ955_01465 [Nanoarchaeota archaeon]|nr:hypothetical protein [Nanoarchaeota archaeon]